MLLQYTAAALTSENKTLSHPSSTDSIPSSGNVEDHVSMGANSALHVVQVLNNLATILAIELMCAAQALEFRKQKMKNSSQGTGTLKAYDLIRSQVPFFEKDAFFQPYLNKLINLVEIGSFSSLYK